MIKNEELNTLMQNPIFKKLIDNFTHQEKEITLLKKELTKINNLLQGEIPKIIENNIKELLERTIKNNSQPSPFQSPK